MVIGVHVLVLVTCPSRDEAEQVARALVDEGLAACVNVVYPVTSIFRWRGRVEEAEEALLLVKSRADLFERLVRRVRELHSYEVPEIIALPVILGDERYLRWVDESLSS